MRFRKGLLINYKVIEWVLTFLERFKKIILFFISLILQNGLSDE
jgi:hypothetical protein